MDPFPILGAPGNRSLYVASDSRYSPQNQTHSRLLECDSLSRPNQPILTEWSLNPEIIKQIFQFWDFRSGYGHLCVSQQRSPTSVHLSSSRATSTGGGCSVTRLAGEINLHVSADSSAQQDHSEITGHPSSRSDNDCFLVAITTVVPTPTSTLYGSPTVLSILLRSSWTESRTICTHGGSLATLQSSRIFRRGV